MDVLILAQVAKVDTGDTAWMLAATALVLMMTPGARALLRGPRAREEHAQHVHDVHRRDRGRRPSRGRSSATRSRSTATGDSSAASTTSVLHDVTFEPRDGTTIPQLRLLGLPGDLLHHHGRAGVGRRRRADALRRRSWSSRRCGRCSSTRCSRTGPSAAAGCRATGRSTSPAACRSRWAPASRRWRPRSSSARARTTGARRSCRTTPSTCCSAPACCGSAGSASTAAAASRPGNTSVLAFTNTLLTPGLHAGRLVRARPDARPAGDRDRRGDRDHRRLRRRSRPPAASSARGGRWRSASLAALPELRGDRAGGRGRGSTRRSTCSPPTAIAGFTGILFIGFFAQHVVERRLGRPLLRQRRAARRPGAGGARGSGLRVRRDVRAAARLIGARHAAARDRARGGAGDGRRPARRGGLRRRARARSSSRRRRASRRRCRSPNRNQPQPGTTRVVSRAPMHQSRRR